MTTLLLTLLTYLSLGVIITISIGYNELRKGIVEYDSKPKIIFNLIKITTLWLPLIIMEYIVD